MVNERNRYFTGKYMTARDFADEQAFFMGRHRLHNRLFHGWGIVCGLDVIEHENAACADRWVIVKAGIAIDCFGRELVLHDDTPVELPLPFPKRDPGSPCVVYGEPPEEGEREHPFLICLTYAEECVEEVPVLYGESCHHDRREHNRIRELVKIELRDPRPGCWGAAIPGQDDHDGCDDCADTNCGAETARTCIAPDCPCGDCLSLALITDFDRCKPNAGFRIDTAGRREIGRQDATSLTRIVDISWKHGGAMMADELVPDGHRHGELRVTFDRAIAETHAGLPVINRNTFTVYKYTDMQEDLEFLSPGRHSPMRDPDNPCVAVFHIPHRALRYLPGHFLHITLRCDFIVDCFGNPVDGNHLRGERPTGDGVPGGTFESWCFIEYDDDSAPESGDDTFDEEMSE
jgi:hypothetical protein